MRHFCTLALALITLAISAQAQNRPNSQYGEIVLEKDKAKVDSYAIQQESSIALVKGLLQNTEALAAGSGSQISPLSQQQIQYLAACYLYCTIQQGTCQEMLDAILEIDIINSRLSKTVQCPNMKAGWKEWIAGDMEKRQSYQVKTGFLNATEEFKRTVRPRYIKCEETVKAEIAPTVSDKEFFSARYSGENSKKKPIERTLKLLEEIKTKIPNIFSATGTR